MIRNKISSDVEALATLKKTHWWIPDENQIRPSLEVIEEKRKLSEWVLSNYISFRDFILDAFFDYATEKENGLAYVPRVSRCEWTFCKSQFPYALEPNVKHYILWNSFYNYNMEFEDSKINSLIEDTLTHLVGSDAFDFAWYKNPKPSIPELYHVQVFWIRKQCVCANYEPKNYF